MKQWIDLIMVILLVVMLSACGKQQGEVLAGQGEDPGSLEQTESSEITSDRGSFENLEKEESSFIDGQKIHIQEDSGFMKNNISFNFETKTVMLNSGYEMPIYGLGTYSLTGETCADSVTAALNRGVRLIDTAYMYHNEERVGEAVRNSGIPREEIMKW